MNCIHCGNPLIEGAKFCGKCGKGVSNEKPIENKKSLSASQIIMNNISDMCSYSFYIISWDNVLHLRRRRLARRYT